MRKQALQGSACKRLAVLFPHVRETAGWSVFLELEADLEPTAVPPMRRHGGVVLVLVQSEAAGGRLLF